MALRLTERVTAHADGVLSLEDVYSGEARQHAAETLVIVGARQPNDALANTLETHRDALTEVGIRTISRIGDTLAPGAIVHAVWSGHHRGETLDVGEEQVLRDAPMSSLTLPERLAALSA